MCEWGLKTYRLKVLAVALPGQRRIAFSDPSIARASLRLALASARPALEPDPLPGGAGQAGPRLATPVGSAES